MLRSRLQRAAYFNECKGTYTCENSHQRGVMRPSLADLVRAASENLGRAARPDC